MSVIHPTGARILELPEGMSWVGLLILIRTRDESGQPGWSVRRTEGLTDEELLGMVTVQADILRERALSLVAHLQKSRSSTLDLDFLRLGTPPS